MVFAQTAFILEDADRGSDRLAQIEAGVEGVLHTYDQLLRANRSDRQPYLDQLIKRREDGSLMKFVSKHATAACNL